MTKLRSRAAATGWLLIALLLDTPGLLQAATITVGAWQPLFKGIDLAYGQQQATLASEPDHQVRCLRVDLTDPDVSLFTTPHCPSCNLDTLSENTSLFLTANSLQVAVNGAFYGNSAGATDTPIGTADNVLGLAISQGERVSVADPSYAATLMFRADKTVLYYPTNYPAASTNGIYTAFSGNHALLYRGTNLRAATPNDLDPRTAVGVSADRHYLFLLTIDGRQPGWSDGADFHDTGEWLKRFGAADGINVDGGGSTTMVMSDCVGNAVRLNQSSFVDSYGRERRIGHNIGVRALPLPTGLLNLTVDPAGTTCLITWNTSQPGTTQVQFGTSTNYDSSTTLDARLKRNHVATLNNLVQGTTYYFRARSEVDGQLYVQECQFTTLSTAPHLAFDITSVWTYTTNNVSNDSWTKPSYSDANWLGSGPGLLYVENNSAVSPRNTPMRPTYGQPIPRTYYFRRHFNLDASPAGASLTFSNYVDDGAVFYLNGVEIQRLRMPAAPTTIANSTAATGTACTGTVQEGDAASICPDVFNVNGTAAASLVQGDNVLAVEVHNYGSGVDLVFGCALYLNLPVKEIPTLHFLMEDRVATLYWNGAGLTLQQTSDLGPDARWEDVPGPITLGPFTTAGPSTRFYRLRQ